MGSQSYILPSLSASPMVLVTPVASRSNYRWCWRRAQPPNGRDRPCRSWGRSSPRLCWTTRTVSSAEDPMPEGLPDWGLTLRSHPGLGWTPWGWARALPGQMVNPPTQYFPAQALALGDEGQPPSSSTQAGLGGFRLSSLPKAFPSLEGWAGSLTPVKHSLFPWLRPCRWLLALGHHGASPGRPGALPATPAAPCAALCAQ